LLNEADGGRFPDRAATLGRALDKYLEVTDLELSTKEAHPVRRPARRRVIPAQLDGFRKRERLRELYRLAPHGHDPGHLASTLGPLAGPDHETALNLLTEFAAQP
jgi:hypothetical protein